MNLTMISKYLSLKLNYQLLNLVYPILYPYQTQNFLSIFTFKVLSTLNPSQFFLFPLGACFLMFYGTKFYPFHMSSFNSEVLLTLDFQTQEHSFQRDYSFLILSTSHQIPTLFISSYTLNLQPFANF